MNEEVEYDVAFSFAGEDRPLADEIKQILERQGIKVFFDNDNKSDLWGENLYVYLSNLYQHKARFCVLLISKYYVEKIWTRHELKAIEARLLKDDSVYLLPVRLDSTKMNEVFPQIAYLSSPPENAQTIAQAVMDKLKKADKSRSENLVVMENISKNDPSEKISINDFQLRLRDMYEESNKNLSIEYIYGFLSRTSGYLCKDLSNNNVKKEDFIRSFSWLLSLSTKIGINVENALISRFPGLCPHCLEKKCICLKSKKKPLHYRPPYKVREMLEAEYKFIINNKQVITFDSARKIITTIYPNNEIIWHYAGPLHHIAKLYEEVSEVHEALSRFVAGKCFLNAVAEEIADVAAWLLGAWDIVYTEYSLDHEFLNYYYNGCPICRQPICTCNANSNRAQGLIDYEFLVNIRGDLERLHNEISVDKKKISTILRSLTSVIDNQNDILARQTLSHISNELESIKKQITDDDDSSYWLILSILKDIRKIMSIIR